MNDFHYVKRDAPLRRGRDDRAIVLGRKPVPPMPVVNRRETRAGVVGQCLPRRPAAEDVSHVCHAGETIAKLAIGQAPKMATALAVAVAYTSPRWRNLSVHLALTT